MYLVTLRKELLQLVRNLWLCGALAVFVGLVSFSLAKGMKTYRELAIRQQERQLEARQDWMEQKTRSAHMATHHGTFVHKVFSPLSAFDLGVDPHLGTSVFLESHRQNAMTEPLIEELVDPLRFDVLSPALLLQFVLPLLVIFLTFSGISREREQGTLPLILSSGLSWRRWVWGKVTASFALVVAVLLIPLVCLGIWLLQISQPVEFTGVNLLTRFGLMSACLLLFLGGWTFLSLAISARVKSSRTALVILLSLWAGWSIVLPRLAVEFARQKSPLPLQEDLIRYSQTQVKYADEEGASRKIYADLEKRLFETYGVSSRKELPLNWGGASMIALEEHTDQLYDVRAARLEEIFVAQDQVLDAAAWGSPYLAMRAVSSAFSGTDRRHHEAFYDAAEQYRRKLVLIMNEFDMAKVKPTREKSGPEVWGLVPEFQYQFPEPEAVIRLMSSPLLVLIVWFLGTGVFMLMTPISR